MRRFFTCLMLVYAAIWLGGCGGDSLDRVPVSGTVTLDGAPLPTGSIRLTPLGKGQSSGGSIEAGAFSIPASDGPAPGEYRVEVVSFQPTGQQVPDPDRPGQTKEETKQVVPARYNRQSKLTATIKADEANNLQFSLTTEAD